MDEILSTNSQKSKLLRIKPKSEYICIYNSGCSIEYICSIHFLVFDSSNCLISWTLPHQDSNQ